jgi:hypothetical protein
MDLIVNRLREEPWSLLVPHTFPTDLQNNQRGRLRVTSALVTHVLGYQDSNLD